MRQRLTLIKQAFEHKGQRPTVAQVAAAYHTMAAGGYDVDLWRALAYLSAHATGVLVDCGECRGGGMVSASARKAEQERLDERQARTGRPPNAKELAALADMVGFTRVPCKLCQGSGQRRVNNPAPGDMSNVHASTAMKALAAQVERALRY